MDKAVALELRGFTKSFGSVIANNNVDLTVYKNEILAILGENGCGKTTLMNMIAGIYFPDSGHILVDGEEVVIRSPKDAFKYKIGMIHQHFKLVDVFSASENIVLGVKDGTRYNLKEVNNRIKEMAEKKVPIDLTTVTTELKNRNILNEVGGVEYLTEIVGKLLTDTFED